MNMPIAIPRTYRPHPGAPIERPLMVSDAERKLIAAMTDGKLDMTPFGIESAYMEASGSGNVKDSHPGQSGTSNTTSHTSGTSSSQSGAHGTSTGNSSSDNSQGSNSNDKGTNTAAHEAQGNVNGTSSKSPQGTPTNSPAAHGPIAPGPAAREPQGNVQGTPVASTGVNQPNFNDAMNDAVRNALTSTEKPSFVTGAGPSVPVAQNAELQTLKNVMDQAVGWQRNPYTESDEALGKTAKALSGETIKGVGAAEVANVMVNRARNPNLYDGNTALDPRQFESMKVKDQKIAARFNADVPGTLNYDRALNNAINGLANPNTINPAARDATDFQEASLAAKNKNEGVNIGGNVFGQHYTKPTTMSSLENDAFMDNAFSGLGNNPTMPIGSSSPTGVASKPGVSSLAGVQTAEEDRVDRAPASSGGVQVASNALTQSPAPVGSPSVPDVPAGDSWFGNLGKTIGEGLTTANEKFTDANQKINEMGGGKKVEAMGKLAQAFGFDGTKFGSGHYTSGPGGQDRGGQVIAHSFNDSKMPIAAAGPTQDQLLAELQTTADPKRYDEIIRLLNSMDSSTVRYGLNMRAA